MVQRKVIVPTQQQRRVVVPTGTEQTTAGQTSGGAGLGDIVAPIATSLTAAALKAIFAPELSALKTAIKSPFSGLIDSGIASVRAALGLETVGVTTTGGGAAAAEAAAIAGKPASIAASAAAADLAATGGFTATTALEIEAAAIAGKPLSIAGGSAAGTGSTLVAATPLLAFAVLVAPALLSQSPQRALSDLGAAPDTALLPQIVRVEKVRGIDVGNTLEAFIPNQTRITLADGTTQIVNAEFDKIQTHAGGNNNLTGVSFDAATGNVIINRPETGQFKDTSDSLDIFGDPIFGSGVIAIGNDIRGQHKRSEGIGKFTAAPTPQLPEGFVPFPTATPLPSALDTEATDIGFNTGPFQAGIPLVDARRTPAETEFDKLRKQFEDLQTQGQA